LHEFPNDRLPRLSRLARNLRPNFPTIFPIALPRERLGRGRVNRG
jgi:hypothetical protein